jgi:hypothetical protein
MKLEVGGPCGTLVHRVRRGSLQHGYIATCCPYLCDCELDDAIATAECSDRVRLTSPGKYLSLFRQLFL